MSGDPYGYAANSVEQIVNSKEIIQISHQGFRYCSGTFSSV